MIYLDYNATTPLAAEVLQEISSSLANDWGNPSSANDIGRQSKAVIDKARNSVAAMIGGKSDDIVFVSGGTEANNLVIHTAIEHFNKSGKKAVNSNGKITRNLAIPHIVTTAIEHDSIRLPLEQLEAEVTFVPVSKLTGHVNVLDIVGALRPSTCLVSVMLANNETGVLQPVADISAAVKKWAKQNEHNMHCSILMHTDAAQAIGKVAVDVQILGIDYLTIVGHKFYGPRIGALYVRDLGTTCTLYPQFFGGGQEKGYRPGTENTPMIVGLGKAADLVTQNLCIYTQHFLKVKNYLEKKLKDAFGQAVKFNSHFQESNILPNTVNVSFLGDGLQGYKILLRCQKLIASVGAACHSQAGGPSKILLACGVPAEIATNALRLSIGRETQKADIDEIILDLIQAIHLLQKENENNTDIS